MIRLFYYTSINNYQDENPPVEMDVQSVTIDNGLVTIVDADGIKQYLKDFFALTYKNDYYFDKGSINVYMFGSLDAYIKSKATLTEVVSEVVADNGFVVLKNAYTQIINPSKLIAITQERKEGSTW